jgi:hypothetical protein
MANETEIRRRVEYAQKQFAAYSARLQAEWSERQMFPSTFPGDRQHVSPLGGEAAFPWGRKKS